MTETQTDKQPGFFEKRPWLVMAILGLYLALLALGTVGEVFKVDWILNLPIYKGP